MTNGEDDNTGKMPRQPLDQSKGYQEKCQKESDRLKVKLARQLQHDMQRLLDNAWHSDVTITTESQEICAHELILRARGKPYYDQITSDPSNLRQENGTKKIAIQGVDPTALKTYLRDIYTKDGAPFAPLNGQNDNLVNGNMEGVISMTTSATDVIMADTCTAYSETVSLATLTQQSPSEDIGHFEAVMQKISSTTSPNVTKKNLTIDNKDFVQKEKINCFPALIDGAPVICDTNKNLNGVAYDEDVTQTAAAPVTPQKVVIGWLDLDRLNSLGKNNPPDFCDSLGSNASAMSVDSIPADQPNTVHNTSPISGSEAALCNGEAASRLKPDMSLEDLDNEIAVLEKELSNSYHQQANETNDLAPLYDPVIRDSSPTPPFQVNRTEPLTAALSPNQQRPETLGFKSGEEASSSKCGDGHSESNIKENQSDFSENADEHEARHSNRNSFGKMSGEISPYTKSPDDWEVVPQLTSPISEFPLPNMRSPGNGAVSPEMDRQALYSKALVSEAVEESTEENSAKEKKIEESAEKEILSNTILSSDPSTKKDLTDDTHNNSAKSPQMPRITCKCKKRMYDETEENRDVPPRPVFCVYCKGNTPTQEAQEFSVTADFTEHVQTARIVSPDGDKRQLSSEVSMTANAKPEANVLSDNESLITEDKQEKLTVPINVSECCNNSPIENFGVGDEEKNLNPFFETMASPNDRPQTHDYIDNFRLNESGSLDETLYASPIKLAANSHNVEATSFVNDSKLIDVDVGNEDTKNKSQAECRSTTGSNTISHLYGVDNPAFDDSFLPPPPPLPPSNICQVSPSSGKSQKATGVVSPMYQDEHTYEEELMYRDQGASENLYEEIHYRQQLVKNEGPRKEDVVYENYIPEHPSEDHIYEEIPYQRMPRSHKDSGTYEEIPDYMQNAFDHHYDVPKPVARVHPETVVLPDDARGKHEDHVYDIPKPIAKVAPLEEKLSIEIPDDVVSAEERAAQRLESCPDKKNEEPCSVCDVNGASAPSSAEAQESVDVHTLAFFVDVNKLSPEPEKSPLKQKPKTDSSQDGMAFFIDLNKTEESMENKKRSSVKKKKQEECKGEAMWLDLSEERESKVIKGKHQVEVSSTDNSENIEKSESGDSSEETKSFSPPNLPTKESPEQHGLHSVNAIHVNGDAAATCNWESQTSMESSQFSLTKSEIVTEMESCDVENSNVSEEEDLTLAEYEACSKLGRDLLKLYLNSIDTDVVLYVDGTEVLAHKCILTARSDYFANILLENSHENNTAVELPGVSNKTIQVIMHYIYGGCIRIDDDVNLLELVRHADLYNLDGLKDAICFVIKKNQCHFFHKPCQTCVSGITEALPLSVAYNLPELEERAFRWITKHFHRVWPTKDFATLPESLQEKCYDNVMFEMNKETVLDLVVDCDKTFAMLPQAKWTETVFGLTSQLLENCVGFLADDFVNVLRSESVIKLAKGLGWHVTIIEETICSAVTKMSVDTACVGYVETVRLAKDLEQGADWNENFVNMLPRLTRKLEQHLLQNSNAVKSCEAWNMLTPEVQQKVSDAAMFVVDMEKPKSSPPRFSSLNRKFRNGHSMEQDHKSPSPEHPKPTKETSVAATAKSSNGTANAPSENNKVEKVKTKQAAKSKAEKPKGPEKSKSSTQLKTSKPLASTQQSTKKPTRPKSWASDQESVQLKANKTAKTSTTGTTRPIRTKSVTGTTSTRPNLTKNKSTTSSVPKSKIPSNKRPTC